MKNQLFGIFPGPAVCCFIDQKKKIFPKKGRGQLAKHSGRPMIHSKIIISKLLGSGDKVARGIAIIAGNIGITFWNYILHFTQLLDLERIQPRLESYPNV